MAAERKVRAIDWGKLRAAYEGGDPVIRLAQVFNVKAAEIRTRASSESWGRNESEEKHQAEIERKRAIMDKRLASAGALCTLSPELRQSLLHDLLVRYLQGEMPGAMAREIGATRATLYYALLGDDSVPAELVTQALTARVAKADEMLEQAKGPAEISRAREMARFARMDLERRRPSLYGQQKRIEIVPGGMDLGERLRRANQRMREVFEAEVVDVQPALPAPQGKPQ